MRYKRTVGYRKILRMLWFLIITAPVLWFEGKRWLDTPFVSSEPSFRLIGMLNLLATVLMLAKQKQNTAGEKTTLDSSEGFFNDFITRQLNDAPARISTNSRHRCGGHFGDS